MPNAKSVTLLEGDELTSFIDAQTIVALARPEVWETVKAHLPVDYVSLVEANLITEARKSQTKKLSEYLVPDAKLADNFDECFETVIKLASELYDFRSMFVGKLAGSQGRGNTQYMAHKFVVPVAGGEIVITPRTEV